MAAERTILLDAGYITKIGHTKPKYAKGEIVEPAGIEITIRIDAKQAEPHLRTFSRLFRTDQPITTEITPLQQSINAVTEES